VRKSNSASFSIRRNSALGVLRMQALADIFNQLDLLPAAMERVEEQRGTSQGIESFLSRMFKKDEGQVH